LRTRDRSGSPLRVLIVDDNADEANALDAIFATWGHGTRVARGGAEALEIARALVPDAAFIKLDMPTMGGFELARRLRSMPRWLTVPLVAISGAQRTEDELRAVQAGFGDHVAMPASLERLEDALQGAAQHVVRSRIHRVASRAAARSASA